MSRIPQPQAANVELRSALAENKPKLAHARARKSVAAAQELYAFSDDERDGDDARLLPAALRLSSQPARLQIPEADVRRHTFGGSGSSQESSTSRGQDTQQKTQSSGKVSPNFSRPRATYSSVNQADVDAVERTCTPGQDDGPFIRFAIDQLTRDEEVRGSRRYPYQDSEDQYSTTTDEAGPSTLPYQGYAPPQPLRSPLREDRRGLRTPVDIRVGPPEQASARKQCDYPDDDNFISAAPITPESAWHAQHDRLAQQKELSAGIAPAHPLETTGTASTSSLVPTQNEVFVAYDPPKPTTQHPRLDFSPAILRPLWLGIFIFLCMLMVVGLIFCAGWSLNRGGLWQYKAFGDSRYFVFQYLPAILGMILLTWLLQIEIAIIRIAPYLAMTSANARARAEAQFLNCYPTQFILPKIEYFRSRQYLLAVSFLIFWLFIFTVPLLGSSFNVGFFGPQSNGVWRWVAVQGVIWTVIVIYILLITSLLLIMFSLRRSGTGLKWDPRSIADLIAILEKANFLNEYLGTEIYMDMKDFRQRLWNSTPRIGYWHTSHRPNDIFYGMGEEGGQTRRYSVEQGRIREKGHKYHNSIESEEDVELGVHSRVQLSYRHPDVRRRYLPWFLSSSSILAWMLIAFVLLIAFYVVAFVNGATTRDGFDPKLRADTNSVGFSPANFLYSFIPGLIGLILYLIWMPLDFTYRRLQPYNDMTTSEGANAEHSLLLDYPFRLPGSVTVVALINGHWAVAALSAMSLINTAIPVLASGTFWAQWYPQDAAVRITAEPKGLYAICSFLALYVVGLAVVVPGRYFMRMPHDSKCLAQVISWLYQSPILLDRAFARCQTKTELQTRLLGERSARPTGFWASVTDLVNNMSQASLTRRAATEEPGSRQTRTRISGDAPLVADAREAGTSGEKSNRSSYLPNMARYGFGVYTGRDGKDHLGLDHVGRGIVLFDN